MTHVYLQHDTFTYMTRFVHMCDHMSTSSILIWQIEPKNGFKTWKVKKGYRQCGYLPQLPSSRLEYPWVLRGYSVFAWRFRFVCQVIWHLCEYLSDTRLGSQFLDSTRCLRDVIYSHDWVICVSASAVIISMVLAVYVTLSIRMTELFVWVPRRCRLGGDYLGGTCCLCDVVRVYCQVICVSTSLKCVTWLIHWFDMRHVTCLGGMSHMWMSHDMYMNTCMSDDMHMRSHALEACHMPRRYSASSFSSKIDVCVYIDTKSLHTYKHTTKRMTGSFVRVSHRYYRVAKTHRLP